VSAPPLPPEESHAYLWWSRGREDEAKVRNEGLSKDARDLRDALEGYARGYGTRVSTRQLIIGLAGVYTPDVLRRKYRT
jgi:hypothetical protein